MIDADGNNGFKMSMAEFKGMVTEALKNIQEQIEDMKKEIKANNKRSVNNTIKIAGLSAGTSALTTFLFLLVKELLAR